MNAKVSVIIPVYNVENWLDECLESVVNQTYKNLEIILIDDGSTDHSGEKCDQWAMIDERIKIIHKKNGGLASARNAGLEKTTGQFVTFVDSDDYIELETIECMLNSMHKESADIVCCAVNKIINRKKVTSREVNEERVYVKEELLDGFYYYQDGLCGSVWNKLFDIKLFDNIRFLNGLNSEDYYVLFLIYLKAKKMFYNNKCLYNYRIRENSICNMPKLTEHSFDKIKISDIIWEKTEKEIPQRIQDAKAHQIISRFYTYLRIISLEHTIQEEKSWKKI